MRATQVRRLPRRAHPQPWAQDQAQMEGRCVSQQPLGDGVLAAQAHPAQAARVVPMGEGSLDQGPCRLIRALPLSVFSRRLAYTAACAALCPAQRCRLRSGPAIRVRTPTSASSCNTCVL